MEHRIGERNKVALPVSVSQGGKFLGRFTTRDVCPGGMSLQGNVANLADSSIVEVALQFVQADATSRQNFKAFVVHQDDGCLGLMWVENPTGLNDCLLAMPAMPLECRHSPSFSAFASRENP